jgi:hypothetical protein
MQEGCFTFLNSIQNGLPGQPVVIFPHNKSQGKHTRRPSVKLCIIQPVFTLNRSYFNTGFDIAVPVAASTAFEWNPWLI